MTCCLDIAVTGFGTGLRTGPGEGLSADLCGRRLPRAAALAMTCCLDIAVTGFGAGRGDADGHDATAFGSKVKGGADDATEFHSVKHQGIRRGHDYVRRRVCKADLPAGICDAWSCVPGTWLCQDIPHRDVRELLADDIHIRSSGNHPEILHRTKRSESLHRHLNHGPAGSHHIDELLRTLRSTHRPEPAADSSRHYHHMICHIINLDMFGKVHFRMQDSDNTNFRLRQYTIQYNMLSA